MKMGKKGQGAMEYLMTYGWAIMVVMIVGIVLWQLGIFKLGTSGTGYSGFGAVKPIDHSYDGSNLNVVFMNAVGSTISLNVSSGGTSATGQPFTVAAGDKQIVPISLSLCSGGADTYDVKLNVTYANTLTGLTHTDSGRVWGPC